MRLWLTSNVLLFSALSFSAGSPGLSQEERIELRQRLQSFYGSRDPGAMNLRVPKYSLEARQFRSYHDFLKLEEPARLPLLHLAQGKSNSALIRKSRERLRSKNSSAEWGAVEPTDRVEQLGEGWLKAPVVYHLDYVPTSGETKLPVWSDDFWKMRYGGISHRYSSSDDTERKYFEATNLYAQPAEWDLLLRHVPLSQMATIVLGWSPAEKYDLAAGDETFSLTRHQKSEGMGHLKNSDVEEWVGMCTGWSAASLMTPRPKQSATLIGARGVPVKFFPSDTKALLTLAWANNTYYVNSIGGHCRAEKAELLPNGRIAQQECFDNNPVTFHLALGNLIGRDHLSFIMDKTFDYEIWNQPIHSYEFTYFDPLNPDRQSKSWKEVAVPYDAAFKSRDRFQSPKTRGVRQGDTFSDQKIRKIVGVIASVVYLGEIRPVQSEAPQKDELVRISYTYDLELYDYQGHLYPMGGEWHQNQHPDYLWIPRRDSFARNEFDDYQLGFTGEAAPGKNVVYMAKSASYKGFPLCQILKEILRRATGEDTYQCPMS